MSFALFQFFVLILGAVTQLTPVDGSVFNQQNNSLPLSHSAKIVVGEQQGCPPEERLGLAREEISAEVRGLLIGLVQLGQDIENPAASCREIKQCNPNSTSGIYWVRASNGTAIETYCDMSRTCCNSVGGWTRVAYLNMTDPTHQCPPPWREITTPVRTCEGTGSYDADNTNFVSCSSVFFNTYGIPYSQVCGRVIGYQYGFTRAFRPYADSPSIGLDEPYVYGVSITHGTVRKHIWTFAAGLHDKISYYGGSSVCPCTSSSTEMDNVPPFIGSNYYCESGANEGGVGNYIFYSDDTLWDGNNCPEGNTCCDFNSPPQFCSTLPEAVVDDIEIRLCGEWHRNDAPIELVEIFVQ